MVWLLSFLACGDPAPTAPARCDDMAEALARDVCYFEEMKALPADSWPEVLTIRAKIKDPVPANAGLLSFVRAQHKDLPRESEDPLCEPLPETEQRQCRRIFESAHLQR